MILSNNSQFHHQVNRTQRYLYEKEGLRPVQMNAYMVIGKFLHVLVMILFVPILILLAQLKCGRKLLLEFPRLFLAGVTSHDGPTEETVEKSEFEMIFIARGWRGSEQLNIPTNKKIIVRVHARNPVYEATSAALLLSATTIINESDKMPEGGGVFTPGTLFRNTNMINELQQHGITFKVERVEE